MSPRDDRHFTESLPTYVGQHVDRGRPFVPIIHIVFLRFLVPSQPPVELKTASKVSPHRIEVSWKPVPSEFLHGTLQNYEVTYKPVMVGEMKKEEEPLKNMMVDGNHTSVVLEDLEPYVRYEISVGARTAKGLGPSDYVLGGMVFY